MAYEVEQIVAPATAQENGRFGVRSEEIVIDRVERPRVSSKPSGGEPSVSKETPVAETGTVSTSLSAGAAALARREQAFRREQLALKQQLDASTASSKELEELRELKKKLEAKDFTTIEKYAPYDEFTDYHIGKLNGVSPEQEAIKEVKSELDAIKKTQADASEKAKQAALTERKKVVLDIVEKSPDFSSIKELKMQDAVVNHIVESWEKDGVDLTPEEACKEVEETLIEEAKRWSVLSKLKAAPAAEVPQAKKPLPPLKQAVTTLTNSMAATGETKLPKKSYANMSENERYKAALQRVQEERDLKSRKA